MWECVGGCVGVCGSVWEGREGVGGGECLSVLVITGLRERVMKGVREGVR